MKKLPGALALLLALAILPAAASAAAVITVTPSFRNYGNVNVSSFTDFQFIVGNSGNQILTVTSQTISGTDAVSFSVVSSQLTPPYDLSPGSTAGVTVRFAPTSGGAKSATLTFASNDPVTPNKQVPLQGTGVGPLLTANSPGLNFGNVHVGASSNLQVLFGNGGGGTLTITSLSISGTDASLFSLVSPPATPINLTNGQSVLVAVQFAPTTIGAKSANLVVASNGSPGPDSSFALIGTSIRPEPVIASIRDIPNDQGGKLKLSWDASTYDTQASPIVDHYWILRSVPPRAALARIERGARARLLGDGVLAEGDLLSTGVATYTIYWELHATVQALHFFEGYSYVASTTSDSTPTSNPYTLFMVVALNAANTSHWDSDPDSGYSVDNLAPAAPAPLTGAYADGATHLHWNPNAEADLAGYRVYRGATSGFVPGPANLIGEPPDTGFADSGPAGSYYKVTALDSHGNESTFALLGPGGTVDVPGAGAVSLALDPPAPSPAIGDADLVFALPSAGHASLVIFDAQGRRVRSLVRGERPAGRQTVHWDGRDDGGRAVGSGIYFARLIANGRALDVRFATMR
jgi:hypothetical protein